MNRIYLPLLMLPVVLFFNSLTRVASADSVAVNLDSLENAVVFTGSGGLAGATSADLGDINGDGFDDVMIGGDARAYVLYGAANSADFASAGADVASQKGFTVTLDDPESRPFNGNVVGLASGDVDGDGAMDVAISFQIETPKPVVINPDTGQPFDPCNLSRIACKGNYLTVIVAAATLQPAGGNVDLSTLDSSQSRLLYGLEPHLNGIQIADVDGDNRDDILISTASVSTFGLVVYSNSTADVNISELDGSDGFTVVRPTSPPYPDARLVAVGDINGDANQDIAIAGLEDTESNTTNVAIIFGQGSAIPASIDINSLAGSNGFHLRSPLVSGSFDAATLAALGDVNADGIDDLGLPAENDGKHWILVVLGSTDGYPTEMVTDQNWFAQGKGFLIEIPEDFCQSFPSPTDVCTPFSNPQTLLTGAGDVNNDGIDDILFGRFGLNLMYGRANWQAQAESTNFIDVEFLPRPGSFSNTGLGPAGDVNGDQIADLVIPLQNGTRTYIVYGTDRSDCIDTDGDGWGWDGVASCRIESAKCIDTDGDGWGWDGVASCRIEQPVQAGDCIDYDPIGDGWGWTGIASCRIETTECIDTVPLNDGWGWDGVASCRTSQTAQPGECVDTDPVGDGWGWNGVESCRISTDADDLINLSTGAPIETINLQWTEEELIAGSMVCETYQWNDNTREYLPESPRQLKQYNHFYQGVMPAPEVPGGWVLDLSESNPDPAVTFSWTLKNSNYQGVAPIGSTDIIEDDPHGFKVWKSSNEYAHCVGLRASNEALESCLYAGSDPDGDGYGWDDRTSCLITTESAPVSEITHAVTGEQIDLVKLQWTWGDFWLSYFSCTEYNYSGTHYVADESFREYVHTGPTAQADESGILRAYSSEGNIVHFRLDDLADGIDNTELYIETNEGTPADTFDVYASAGKTVITPDEWNTQTFIFADACQVDSNCTLAHNVTELLQNAKDNGDTFLSFKFEGRNGTNGEWLDEAVLSWRNDASPFWLEAGVYNGPAPIDAIAQITDDGAIRSWASGISYTECGIAPQTR